MLVMANNIRQILETSKHKIAMNTFIWEVLIDMREISLKAVTKKKITFPWNERILLLVYLLLCYYKNKKMKKKQNNFNSMFRDFCIEGSKL